MTTYLTDDQYFLAEVHSWNSLHVSGSFASNGVVAIRVDDIDLASTKLAQLVSRYGDPDQLPEARLVAKLPPINDLPRALVFAPTDRDLSRLDNRKLLDSVFLISVSLYILITGKININADYWSYRCFREVVDGQSIPIMAVYDIDMELVGFCCGLEVADRNRDAVQVALVAALEAGKA